MKLKQLIALSIILIALALLVVWKNTYQSPAVKNEEETNLNISFNPDQVSEIEIKKASSSVLIKKENGAWQVPARWNAKADAAKVKQFIEVVHVVKGEFRSDQADLLSDYEIGDADALQISVSGNGKKLAELDVGLKRTDRGGMFVRLHGSNAVYFSSDSLLPNIGFFGDLKNENPKLDFWIDFRLLDITPDQVKSISLTQFKDGSESVAFNLERSPDSENAALQTWILKNVETPFPIDGEKVKGYLHKFQFERAREILDPEVNYSVDSPDFKLTVGESSGAKKTLLFKKHDQKSDDYVVSLIDEKRAVLISGSTAKSFQVDNAFFRKEDQPIKS